MYSGIPDKSCFLKCVLLLFKKVASDELVEKELFLLDGVLVPRDELELTEPFIFGIDDDCRLKGLIELDALPLWSGLFSLEMC